jgi:hypothetical protein
LSCLLPLEILLEYEYANSRKSLWILRFQRLNAAMIYQPSTLQPSFSPDFMRVFHRPNARNPPFITVFATFATPQSIVEEATLLADSTTCCAPSPHKLRVKHTFRHFRLSLW